MSAARDLILYALHQLGKVSTAADVSDRAAAIAIAEGWPKASFASISPSSAVAHLKNCAEKAGSIKDPQGNNRPLWQPVGGNFDAQHPLPASPQPARTEPPLSQAQAMTVIQSYEDLLQLQGQRITEQDGHIARLRGELDAAAASQRQYTASARDLLARVRDRFHRAGLAEES